MSSTSGPSSPHYVTPIHIIDAGVKGLYDGLTNHAPALGLPEFKTALAEKHSAHNHLDADPDKDIMVVPGSQQGLYYEVDVYVDPGDEVLLVEPVCGSFRQQVELAEATPVSVSLSAEEEYHLSYEALEECTTARAKLLIFNNPQSPQRSSVHTRRTEDVARFA